MAWTPKYTTRFTKPLIRQLCAFIQRDQRAALDWVGGTGILPSFVSYSLSPIAIPQFPAALIAPGPTVFDRDAVGSLKYETAIYCAIAVTHQDQDAVSELLQDYLQAMDALINTIPLSDFYQQWQLTLPIIGTVTTEALDHDKAKLNDLFIVGHTPEIRPARNKFAMAATLELRVDMEEV